MNYKKDKTLNLALKSSILNNKNKNFYKPIIVPNINLSLNSKNYTSISKSKNKNTNIFINKFPSKTIILSSNSKHKYNSINNNNH